MSMRILEVKNLTSGYGETDILHDLSIKLEKKEVVSIIGPNGAGKSTLLKTIFGILTPRQGVVQLQDEEITGLSPDKIVRKGMSYVPQVDNVFPSLTIQENLEMGA
ncbi:MAG: ATP-binding cassette domain-containing protein, partial [Deltaproteobacteria bacterium]|nr:ATP-binding cassette domain-containing protein [Deltaproteobacteria bacterium]